MAQVDFSRREITIKLVYYGPALSGKTTNLQQLHARLTDSHRSRLMTLETANDRTLFFDFLSVEADAPAVQEFARAHGLTEQAAEPPRRAATEDSGPVIEVRDEPSAPVVVQAPPAPAVEAPPPTPAPEIRPVPAVPRPASAPRTDTPAPETGR